MKTTHTFAILELSPIAFAEISRKLKLAGYRHSFIKQDGRELIGLNGIGVVKEPPKDDTKSIINLAVKLSCTNFQIAESKIIKKGRGKEQIVFARQVAMYLATRKGISDSEVGRYFGKDHGTISHAAVVVSNRMDTDQKIKQIVEEIERQLNDSLVISGL